MTGRGKAALRGFPEWSVVTSGDTGAARTGGHSKTGHCPLSHTSSNREANVRGKSRELTGGQHPRPALTPAACVRGLAPGHWWEEASTELPGCMPVMQRLLLGATGQRYEGRGVGSFLQEERWATQGVQCKSDTKWPPSPYLPSDEQPEDGGAAGIAWLLAGGVCILPTRSSWQRPWAVLPS